MGKRNTKAQNQETFEQLIGLQGTLTQDEPDGDDDQTAEHGGNNLMKKFRFQLLHEWLIAEVQPCRVADIGGGKGLLAYLLRNSGWEATVIDPVDQELPRKYKDFHSKKRILVPQDARVPRITRNFASAMAAKFDLLVGLHAHGCNVQIIDASADYDAGFLLLPCCVIDEPFFPRRGATWVGALTDYALRQGFDVKPFRLAFSGQNIGIYAPPRSSAVKPPIAS